MSTFCKLSYHRKCKRRGVSGQKSKNLVNVVCEGPLTNFIFMEQEKSSFNQMSSIIQATVPLGDWLEKKKVTAIIIKQQFGFPINYLNPEFHKILLIAF
jgi:hypothetical protein